MGLGERVRGHETPSTFLRGDEFRPTQLAEEELRGWQRRARNSHAWAQLRRRCAHCATIHARRGERNYVVPRQPIATLVAALGVVSAGGATRTRWLHTGDLACRWQNRQLDAAQYSVHYFPQTSRARSRPSAVAEQFRTRGVSARGDRQRAAGRLPEGIRRGISGGVAERGPGQARFRPVLPARQHKCSLADNGITIMETPYAHGLFSLLLSQAFVSFLEDLTGIMGIISDNAFKGGRRPDAARRRVGDPHRFPLQHAPAHAARQRLPLLQRRRKEEYGDHLSFGAPTTARASGARPSPKQALGAADLESDVRLATGDVFQHRTSNDGPQPPLRGDVLLRERRPGRRTTAAKRCRLSADGVDDVQQHPRRPREHHLPAVRGLQTGGDVPRGHEMPGRLARRHRLTSVRVSCVHV